jgi:hypothetical protein
MSVSQWLVVLLVGYAFTFLIVFAVRFVSPKRNLKVRVVASWVEGTAWIVGFLAIAGVTLYKNW